MRKLPSPTERLVGQNVEIDPSESRFHLLPGHTIEDALIALSRQRGAGFTDISKIGVLVTIPEIAHILEAQEQPATGALKYALMDAAGGLTRQLTLDEIEAVNEEIASYDRRVQSIVVSMEEYVAFSEADEIAEFLSSSPRNTFESWGVFPVPGSSFEIVVISRMAGLIHNRRKQVVGMGNRVYDDRGRSSVFSTSVTVGPLTSVEGQRAKYQTVLGAGNQELIVPLPGAHQGSLPDRALLRIADSLSGDVVTIPLGRRVV